MKKPKTTKRIKPEIGRGTPTPRLKKVGTQFMERSTAYSARPRPVTTRSSNKISAKAEPRKFSVATTKPRKNNKPKFGL